MFNVGPVASAVWVVQEQGVNYERERVYRQLV